MPPFDAKEFCMSTMTSAVSLETDLDRRRPCAESHHPVLRYTSCGGNSPPSGSTGNYRVGVVH